MSKPEDSIIGLVPAAGFGTRLGALPGSKEMVPLGRGLSAEGQPWTVPVIEPLLRHFEAADIGRVLVLQRSEKIDLSRFLGARQGEAALASLMIGATPSAVHSLDHAYPFIAGHVCALGYPDIYFAAERAYARLLEALRVMGGGVVLGTLPTSQPERVDVVETTADGAFQNLRIKQPPVTATPRTWVAAVWSPGFTELLHTWVASLDASAHREAYVGDVILAAAASGMRVSAVPLGETESIDAGTPEGLAAARALYTAHQTEEGGYGGDRSELER